MRKQSVFATALLAAGVLIGQTDSQQERKTTKSRSEASTQTTEKKREERTSHEQTSQQAGTMSARDKNFIIKAAQGGMAEVKLAELAEQRASSDEVKRLAEHIRNDHEQANKELKDIAAKEGVTLPSDVDSKHKATYDRLSKLSGAEFDRAYAREMVNDHKRDVAEFKKTSNTARDTDLKEFASKTTPKLEEHLKHAQQIAGGSAAADGRTSERSGRERTGDATRERQKSDRSPQ